MYAAGLPFPATNVAAPRSLTKLHEMVVNRMMWGERQRKTWDVGRAMTQWPEEPQRLLVGR